MANYLTAIRSGLEQANLAEVQQREIDRALAELNAQVAVGSKNKAKIKFHNLTRSLTDGEPSIRRMISPDQYKALVLTHQVFNIKPMELAEWRQEKIGYPVDILIGKLRLACADLASLEAVFMRIVSEKNFGIKLKNIMQYDPSKDEKVAKQVEEKIESKSVVVKEPAKPKSVRAAPAIKRK